MQVLGLVWVEIVGVGLGIRLGSGIRVWVVGWTASPKNSSPTPLTCPHHNPTMPILESNVKHI